MLNAEQIKKLESLAKTIRVDILKMLNQASSGHTGGSLSAVEIIVSLYFHKMRHNPKDPTWPDRDRFVLSKGHGAPALYTVLARSGYFDLSLGQGLSMANGMALALKLDKRFSRVYVLMGDGENQEGQIWEAAMAAAHYKLDNVCGILDHNGLQIDGPVNEIMEIEPIADKWACFGWEVFRVNGHDFQEIISALDKAETVKNKPSLIVARTIKGKGVSFFEGKVEYHGIPPTDEELAKALIELGIKS